MVRKVVVFTEVKNGHLRNVTFECLTAAQRIAQGGEIIAVLFGDGQEQFVEQLGRYGADKVVIIENEKIQQYTPDAFKQTMERIIAEIDPEVILLGHTGIGKDVAPRLAAKLGIGLISDCIDILVQDDEAIFLRPIYAGKAFQKKKFIGSQKWFATIRPNNIRMEENPKKPETMYISVEIKDLRTTISEVVQKASSGVDLTEANVVVAGGRGVKGEEGFKLLQGLADELGGAVGASRGACDANYCDYSLQIGQTGKVVTPDLYIACGISGAIQHLAGMSQSKIVVAINKDPEAPIFKVADYGIVGDLFEVLPLLIDELKKRTNEK
jgi:electron transfer flavoprotein alpha subunit